MFNSSTKVSGKVLLWENDSLNIHRERHKNRSMPVQKQGNDEGICQNMHMVFTWGFLPSQTLFPQKSGHYGKWRVSATQMCFQNVPPFPGSFPSAFGAKNRGESASNRRRRRQHHQPQLIPLSLYPPCFHPSELRTF